MRRISIGDIRLNVEERGQGRPVLLVHGFPLDHSMWRGQMEGLSADYRVIAPDLRGFGQSDVSESAVSMEQFADDLAALLDALDITRPLALCGLSMGGYILWQFWRRHGQRLDRLILTDTRAVADTAETALGRLETAQRVLRDGPSSLVETMIPKLFAETTLRQRPELVAGTREVMLANDPRGIAAALRAMAARPDFLTSLAEIQVPTLVLCGQWDAISSPDEMRGIAQTIPRARFVEISGAGHMAPLEQPAAVNAALRQFLGEDA